MIEFESIPEWERDETCEPEEIVRRFQFKSYDETMAFVNAVAWIARKADHHPEMRVGYKTCDVRYTTWSAGGLTQKDVDCARAVDGLVAE